MRVYDLYKAGKLQEAQEAQLRLARAEYGFARGGINGTKWVVARLRGYPEESSRCRRPYPEFASPERRAWITETAGTLQEAEAGLGKRGVQT